MEIILQYKYLILIILEIFATLSTALVFFARYWLNSEFLFKLSAVLLIITGVIPQITLMILDTIHTKKLGVFGIIVILLIIYSCTLGRKHIAKLDKSIKEYVQTKKQEMNKPK